MGENLRNLKLVIISKEYDSTHPISGFFYTWVNEISKYVKLIHLIVYHYSTEPTSNNIKIYTTSKRQKNVLRIEQQEVPKKRNPIIGFLAVALKVNRLILKAWQNGGFDLIFCHMNPEFVIASYFLAKVILRRPIVLWYLHRSRSIRLLVAYMLADKVLTAHPLGAPKGSKTVILSHGIEVPDKKATLDRPVILYVGRISRSKHIETIIEGFLKALNYLDSNSRKELQLRIVGPIIELDYAEELKRRFSGISNIKFVGPIKHNEVWNEYLNASIFVSASKTGLDKTVLEAMASGLPVLVNDKIYRDTLEELSNFCIFETTDELAHKIYQLITDINNRRKIGEKCRSKVISKHSLRILIVNLLKELLL